MIMGLLGSIFGSKDVISAGINAIDDLHYSDEEEAEDKRKLQRQKVDLKIKEKESYHPYKLAQRMIAFSFVGMYIFIMLNGVISSLYGWIDITNVDAAMLFANKMYLGEITLTIIGFYFGDAMVQKFTNKGK